MLSHFYLFLFYLYISYFIIREESLVKTQRDNYNHAFTEIISSHCVLLTTAQGDQILTLPINSSTTRLLLWVQLLCDWHRKFQFWYFQQQRIGIWFFDGYPCIVFLWVFLFLRNLSDWRQWKNGIILDQNKLLQGW